jgi:hypothetical protein
LIEGEPVTAAGETADRSLKTAGGKCAAGEARRPLKRGLGDNDLRPQQVQQFILGHDAVRVCNEMGQQIENQGLDLLRLAVEAQLAGRFIKLKRSKLVRS